MLKTVFSVLLRSRGTRERILIARNRDFLWRLKIGRPFRFFQGLWASFSCKSIQVHSACNSTAWNYLCICGAQNADSICGLTAVKPCPPQPKAAVSPRWIPAGGRGEDYNRLLYALFQKAAFALERDIMRLANRWKVRKLLGGKDAVSENNWNLYIIWEFKVFLFIRKKAFQILPWVPSRRNLS